MFEIHSPGPDDWQLIRDIRLRSLEESPHAFVSTYAREVEFDEALWRDRSTTCHWFVAIENAAPVGVAGGVDGWSDDRASRELVGMWVAPSHRGQGIARQLLGAVSNWARSDGASVLSLGVREGNDQARASYLRMGLRSSGETVVERDHPGRVIEIMVLDLGPPLDLT